MGDGVISSYNTGLGFGIVDAIDDDGTVRRYEISRAMLPYKLAGLRAGQKVKLHFEEQTLTQVEPDDQDRPAAPA